MDRVTPAIMTITRLQHFMRHRSSATIESRLGKPIANFKIKFRDDLEGFCLVVHFDVLVDDMDGITGAGNRKSGIEYAKHNHHAVFFFLAYQ